MKLVNFKSSRLFCFIIINGTSITSNLCDAPYPKSSISNEKPWSEVIIKLKFLKCLSALMFLKKLLISFNKISIGSLKFLSSTYFQWE